MISGKKPDEAEKRLHRCCFAGPEFLGNEEDAEDRFRLWFISQIRASVRDGYLTYICGMTEGADLLAGTVVQSLKPEIP